MHVHVGNAEVTREVPVGEWKPTHPGFDYLALIEKDKQKQKQEHDRLNIIPSTDTEKKQTGNIIIMLQTVCVC